MLKIICGWLLLLILIVLGARLLWKEEAAQENAVVSTPEISQEISQEDLKLLEDAHPEISAAFNGFLNSPTPEEQNQFVMNASSTAAKMVRYYSSNSLIKIDFAKTSLTKSAVLELPGGKVIETLWKNEDGRKFDAVFHEENGEWKLDWEHLARFSTEPWVLFLSGDSTGEGEFRLLARERLAKERKDAVEMSLVLYAPRFGNPGDTGFQSPEILVKRDSPVGKLLSAAFKQAEEEKPVYGSRLATLDPDDMIRIRAVIRRFQTDDVTRFEITRVIACHWHGIDDAGVEIAEEKKE